MERKLTVRENLVERSEISYERQAAERRIEELAVREAELMERMHKTIAKKNRVISELGQRSELLLNSVQPRNAYREGEFTQQNSYEEIKPLGVHARRLSEQPP
jgi:hypothetical protein